MLARVLIVFPLRRASARIRVLLPLIMSNARVQQAASRATNHYTIAGRPGQGELWHKVEAYAHGTGPIHRTCSQRTCSNTVRPHSAEVGGRESLDMGGLMSVPPLAREPRATPSSTHTPRLSWSSKDFLPLSSRPEAPWKAASPLELRLLSDGLPRLPAPQTSTAWTCHCTGMAQPCKIQSWCDVKPTGGRRAGQ